MPSTPCISHLPPPSWPGLPLAGLPQRRRLVAEMEEERSRHAQQLSEARATLEADLVALRSSESKTSQALREDSERALAEAGRRHNVRRTTPAWRSSAWPQHHGLLLARRFASTRSPPPARPSIRSHFRNCSGALRETAVIAAATRCLPSFPH